MLITVMVQRLILNFSSNSCPSLGLETSQFTLQLYLRGIMPKSGKKISQIFLKFQNCCKNYWWCPDLLIRN